MAHKHTIGFARTMDFSSFSQSDLNIKDKKPLRDVPVLSPEIKALFGAIETSDAFGAEAVYKKFSGIKQKKQSLHLAIIQTTKTLASDFQTQSLDLNLFIEKFKIWKESGTNGEDGSYLFGKDGSYVTPLVDGKKYQLQHVHLTPIINLQNKIKWDIAWQRGSRRTSDRVLVYAKDKDKYLLIAILPEPTAHQIAKMATPVDKDLMESFALIAAQFIFDGQIID